MPRKQKDTSRLSYEKIMANGTKDNHYKKIILALEWIIKGNNWDIAKQARLKPEQVWKRTGELCKLNEDGVAVLIDTGIRKNNPDGNEAVVYALYSDKEKYKNFNKEVAYSDQEPSAGDIACAIIAKTKKAKLKQASLFMD